MKITDLNGIETGVTCLGEAIRTAERYREYRHLDQTLRVSDERLPAYCTDIYDKLVQLRSRPQQARKT